MKNLVKKLVLSVLVACTVITAIPVTNAHAEIKPYMKYKQLWIDLDKTTPEKYIDMVHKYGKKGIKEKVQYYLGFKVKAKTDKQVIKKVNNFDKRVMKAKYNKYGISMGASLDEAKKKKREKGKKTSMNTTQNKVIYM